MGNSLRLSPMLALALSGCFEDPPSTSSDEGSTSAAGTSSEGTSPGTTTTEAGSTDAASSSGFGSGLESSTGPLGTSTGGVLRDTLFLFPETCKGAIWAAGPLRLECGDGPLPGPYLVAHENFSRGDTQFERVVEVHPPAMLNAPVDGFYGFDVTGFVLPVFRAEVACTLDPSCLVNFAITLETPDGEVLANWGGEADSGDPVEVALEVLPDAGVLHINLSTGTDAGDEDTLLLIDPRIDEDF